ncbi:hypothetical protein [Sphingomonas sp. CLY1604]|uniref:hypothetical protein n=1 Tax=Sphingomonas sp. CLY1604 TaxID=3457786 RepID=UPI003FD6DAEE
MLRRWISDPADAVLDRIGSTEVRASADAAQRLSELTKAASPRAIIAEVEHIVSNWDAPAPSLPLRWLPARLGAARIMTAAEINAVADRLEAERDQSERCMIALRSAKERMAKTSSGLDEALTIIRSMRPLMEAAARELRVDQPSRAFDLQHLGSAKLLEREQALLTQQAIHQQALMTLDVMIAGQTILQTAIVRARTATLSALQVAMAARLTAIDRTRIDPGIAAMRARDKLRSALAEAREAMDSTATSDVPISPLDS